MCEDCKGPTAVLETAYKTKEREEPNQMPQKLEGDWCHSEDQISSLFFQHFKNLYNPNVGSSPSTEDDSWFFNLPKLTQEEGNGLIKPFTLEEIKEAVISMKPFKSSGPDGIPPIFMHQNWEIVKNDLYQAVNFFFVSVKMLKEMNRTYITLIPK
ncbi:hypothetical protein RDABS01_024794, partial [Bienertia sinuspersici]